MLFKNYFKHFLHTFLIIFLLIFMIGIFGTSEIFFGNYKEFGFIYGEFGWKFLFWGTALAFTASLLIALLPDMIRRPILGLTLGISVAGYLQIMFLNNTLGQIGVTAEGYIINSVSAVKNIIIWLIVIILVLFLTYLLKDNWKKFQQLTSLVLLLIQLVAFGTLFLTADEGAFSYPENEVCLSGEKQYTVSSEKNVILFVLDNFSAYLVNDVLQSYPDLLENLADFTYYNNADCNYWGTFPSLAHMLTGNSLRTDLSTDDWLYECWNNDTTNAFYNLLKENHYTVNLYTPLTDLLTGTYPLTMLSDKIDNIVTLSSNIEIDYPLLYETLFKMSCYRFMPEYFKPIFDVSNDEYAGIVSYTDNQMQYSNPNFYNALLENHLTTDDTTNYFTIHHLNGTHEFINDENCQYDRENATPESTVRGIFVMLAEYLNQLQKLGVYDRSTIIITADHGAENNSQMIFFIKEAYQTHDEIRITNAPITLHELMPTIVNSIGEDASAFGQTIYDFEEGELRERQLYIRTLDSDYPRVPKFDADTNGGMNCYYVYTYTGGREELIDVYLNDMYTIVPVVDSYF